MLLPYLAHGQGEASVAQISPTSKKEPLSLDLSLETATNLLERSDAGSSASSSLETVITKKWNSKNASTLTASIDKSWNDEQELTFSNTALRYIHGPYALNRDLSLTFDGFATLPTSKASHVDESLLVGFALRPNLKIDLSKRLLNGLAIYLRTSVTRNIHEYTVSASGKSNPQYVWTNRIDLEYQMTKKFGILFVGSASNLWTYEGNLYQNFRALQELSYSPLENLSIALGHRNEGSQIKANGETSNISVFNSRASVVYSGLSYTF